MKQTITALYLVKNEEEFLPLSVATVINDVDELIIIDNESTDKSKEIGQEIARHNPRKAKFIEMEGDFDHNCEYNNRNRAIKFVTSKWIMVLDADQLMSDNWHRWIKEPISNNKFDAVRVRYEHLVGSYEHIHTKFYEKQKDPLLHPDVPLWQTVLFRARLDLECTPASMVDSRFKDQHHASFDNSMVNRKFYNCGSATVFHYGFSKKNMMDMSAYRIHRGDYGHEPELKERMTRELRESGNPFRFIGDAHKVDYGKESVPSVMRDKFGTTYKLELDSNGFIQSRIHIPTGVRM